MNDASTSDQYITVGSLPLHRGKNIGWNRNIYFSDSDKIRMKKIQYLIDNHRIRTQLGQAYPSVNSLIRNILRENFDAILNAAGETPYDQ